MVTEHSSIWQHDLWSTLICCETGNELMMIRVEGTVGGDSFQAGSLTYTAFVVWPLSIWQMISYLGFYETNNIEKNRNYKRKFHFAYSLVDVLKRLTPWENEPVLCFIHKNYSSTTLLLVNIKYQEIICSSAEWKH